MLKKSAEQEKYVKKLIEVGRIKRRADAQRRKEQLSMRNAKESGAMTDVCCHHG